MSHSEQPQRSLDFCLFLKFHPYGYPCISPYNLSFVTLHLCYPVISVALNRDLDGFRKEKLPHTTAKEQFSTGICLQANVYVVTGVHIPSLLHKKSHPTRWWWWYEHLKMIFTFAKNPDTLFLAGLKKK